MQMRDHFKKGKVFYQYFFIDARGNQMFADDRLLESLIKQRREEGVDFAYYRLVEVTRVGSRKN